MARPTKFNEERAQAICRGLAAGGSRKDPPGTSLDFDFLIS